MRSRLKAAGIAISAAILIAGFLFGAAPAQAHQMRPFGDAVCNGAADFRVIYGPIRATSQTGDNNLADIYLYYSNSKACVQGRVYGPAGAEIWLDRCTGRNGTGSCTGFIGKTVATMPGLWDTGNWNDNGVSSRACGSSGAQDHDIVCTGWY